MDDHSGRRPLARPPVSGDDGYDLSVLKSIESFANPEIPQRLALLALSTVALVLSFSDWVYAVWYLAYLGALCLYLWLVRAVPERSPARNVVLVGVTSFVVSMIFSLLGVYLWTLPGPYSQSVSIILLMGAMVHTHTGRARERVLLTADLSSIFVGIVLRIGWLLSTPPAGEGAALMAFALVAGYAYFMLISLDVARTHRALEDARRQEVASAKYNSLGRLAAGFAHDFNNLLQAILGNIELARQAGSKDERDLHLAESELAARRGATLTSRLLDLSRKATHAPETIDAAMLIEALRDRAAAILPASHAVQWEIEPGLPSVLADRARLLRALENLLRNASEAMPGGGTIRVGASRATGVLRLVVADEGSGIDPALRDLIFDPYFSTKPKGTAAGLGLSEARGIIEQAGGHIRLDTSAGKGTRVTVEVPLA